MSKSTSLRSQQLTIPSLISVLISIIFCSIWNYLSYHETCTFTLSFECSGKNALSYWKNKWISIKLHLKRVQSSFIIIQSYHSCFIKSFTTTLNVLSWYVLLCCQNWFRMLTLSFIFLSLFPFYLIAYCCLCPPCRTYHYNNGYVYHLILVM